jgi:hypothetical protein
MAGPLKTVCCAIAVITARRAGHHATVDHNRMGRAGSVNRAGKRQTNQQSEQCFFHFQDSLNKEKTS